MEPIAVCREDCYQPATDAHFRPIAAGRDMQKKRLLVGAHPEAASDQKRPSDTPILQQSKAPRASKKGDLSLKQLSLVSLVT